MAKSNALKFGILGAFTGLLDAKISDWKTRLAEEAEMRKQARLEQLLIERENRAETRAIASEERANDRWFEQADYTANIQAEARQDTQEHEVAKMGLGYEYQRMGAQQGFQYRMAEQDDQQAAAREIQEMNNAAQIEAAKARLPDNEYADIVMIENPQTGEQKFDSLTTLRQQGIPAGWRLGTTRGVTSAMPSASKSGAPATTPRPGAGRPAAPRDYSGFSVVPQQ